MNLAEIPEILHSFFLWDVVKPTFLKTNIVIKNCKKCSYSNKKEKNTISMYVYVYIYCIMYIIRLIIIIIIISYCLGLKLNELWLNNNKSQKLKKIKAKALFIKYKIKCFGYRCVFSRGI